MAYSMVINGRRVEGAATLDVVDPATAEVFASCARADEAQLNDAVAAAKAAFPGWAATPHAERQAALNKWADAIEAELPRLTSLLTQEQGKPTGEAQFEVGGAAAILRYFAAQEIGPEVLVDTDNEKVIELRSPLGVVAAITPWNFPVILLMIKAASALTTGNTMVAKPAPTTPLTTLALAELTIDVLPPGVFNVIVDANDLGAKLTSHPDIAKVSFTGSTETGRRVMESAASTLKRLTLELGGNDAAIVLDDVDIKSTARNVFTAATMNAGQVCMAAKRIFAPRKIYDEFCEELASIANSTVVDAGNSQGAQIGPLQNQQQYDKVLDLIADSKKHGRVIAGGDRLDRKGYFIPPTVVRDLPDDARLVREEQFGPVIPVLAYDTEDEVIERANDSNFGLAGTIWTSDVERGVALAARMETGTIWVNKFLDLRPDVPFGGAKQSGIGREQGLDGLKEFTQAKIINVAKAPA